MCLSRFILGDWGIELCLVKQPAQQFDGAYLAHTLHTLCTRSAYTLHAL